MHFIPRHSTMRSARRSLPAAATGGAAGSHPEQGWDGLLICMAIFMLIAMGRLHHLVPGLESLRPGLVIATLSLVLFLGSNVPARALRHLRHPLGWVALFFLLWAVLGAPFGYWPGQSIRFLAGDFLRVVIFFILLAACIRSVQDVRRLVMTLAIGGMLFSVFAALPVSDRMVGAGGYDANDSAMFLVATLPLILYLMTRERHTLYRLLFVAALVVSIVGIIRTGSRGGFLALLVVVAYTVFLFGGIRPIFRLATVAVITLVMLFAATGEYWERMESISDPTDYNQTDPEGRKAIWARARGYMLANPVLGVGITNFPVAEGLHPMIAGSIARGVGFKYSAAHSNWYQVGAEMGFPGLLAFVAMFGLSILYLLRLQRHARAAPQSETLQEAAGLSSALIGSLIAIMVAGTFLSNAYWAMVWGMFALVLGLLKVLRLQGIDVARRLPPATAASLPGRGRRSLAVARSAQLRPSVRGR